MEAGTSARRSDWRPSWRRVGGMAAIAAPVLMWAEFIGHGLARPGYNLLTRAASDLAARGEPDATSYVIGFFYVPGLLVALLGVGLWRAARGGRTWRVGTFLVVAEGLLLVLAGAFREDPTSATATSLHQNLATACFTAAMLAPLVLLRGTPARTAFGPPRRLWLLSGAALAALQVSGMLVGTARPFPPGFVQRPFGLVLTVWFVSTGAWLLRLPDRDPDTGAAWPDPRGPIASR